MPELDPEATVASYEVTPGQIRPDPGNPVGRAPAPVVLPEPNRKPTRPVAGDNQTVVRVTGVSQFNSGVAGVPPITRVGVVVDDASLPALEAAARQSGVSLIKE